MLKRYISFILVLLLTSAPLFGQKKGIPPRPNPPRLVNNFSKSTDFITKAEEAQLEAKLQAFANQTSNQIAIVIVDDLAGLEPWEYATEVGDQWKLGQEKQDNGIVILIKPTGGKGERKYFIAVGKGLEGPIPDLTTKRIEEQELVANFKEGKFYEGLDKTTDVLMALAKGEYNSDQYGAKSKGKSGNIFQVVFILIIFIAFIIIGMKRNNKGGGGGRGGFTMGSRGIWLGGLGGFGGGRSSGGGFGGGSSGGFGGFGGGSFGGGGSGGSW